MADVIPRPGDLAKGVEMKPLLDVKAEGMPSWKHYTAQLLCWIAALSLIALEKLGYRVEQTKREAQ